MKTTRAVDIQPGNVVTGTFLVTQHALKTSRDGVAYLALTLSDRTGNVEARAWRDVEQLARRCAVDDFVAVRGEAELFGANVALTLHDIERLEDGDVELSDYFERSRWQSEAMLAQLQSLVAQSVRSSALRAFLDAVFNDASLMKAFCKAPAALKNHHAYHGGLLEHCLSMARLAVSVGRHYEAYYPGMVDTDLVVAGCILHDIAKCEELTFDRATRYSDVGKLVGHIPLGAQWVARYAELAGTPDDLRVDLQHLVLSHHGRLEYGSPVVPQTPEAHALHYIDMLDSKMNAVWTLFDQTQRPGWSEYSRSLEARIHFRGAPDWSVAHSQLPSELEGPGLTRHNGED